MIPDWFWAAVETPSTEHRVEVDDVDVLYRVWDDGSGRPGLLLVHGMNAHSRWWDFIAPQLMDRYRIVALDLSGMGDSDYRYDYGMDTWARELVAVADAAGLETGVPVAAHSFGGRVALRAYANAPDRFGPLVLLDSAVRSIEAETKRQAERPMPRMGGAGVVYPTRAIGEERFRLQPPQPCDNEYIVQYIAKQSLMPMEGGFAWKFDDDLLEALAAGEGQRDWIPDAFAAIRQPVALLYGAESELFDDETVAAMQAMRPQAPLSVVALADARHHLFVDQPQAFVAALRELLEQLA